MRRMQRRLAASARPDERHELAGRDGEVDARRARCTWPLRVSNTLSTPRTSTASAEPGLAASVAVLGLRVAHALPPPSSVVLEDHAEQGDEPAATRPSTMAPKIGAHGLRRVARGLAGELDEDAADAALQPGRHLGHDRADHGVRRAEPQRRQQVGHGCRAAAASASVRQ